MNDACCKVTKNEKQEKERDKLIYTILTNFLFYTHTKKGFHSNIGLAKKWMINGRVERRPWSRRRRRRGRGTRRSNSSSKNERRNNNDIEYRKKNRMYSNAIDNSTKKKRIEIYIIYTWDFQCLHLAQHPSIVCAAATATAEREREENPKMRNCLKGVSLCFLFPRIDCVFS